MGAGAEITTARLSAYQPVTSRLMKALRRNMRAATAQTPSGPMVAFIELAVTDGSGDDGAYADVGTFELIVPGDLDGPNGVFIETRCTLELENDSRAVSASAEFRLKHGSDVGASVEILQGSASTTTSTSDKLSLNATAITPDVPNTITVECKVTLSETSPIGISTARYKWGREDTGLIRQQ